MMRRQTFEFAETLRRQRNGRTCQSETEVIVSALLIDESLIDAVQAALATYAPLISMHGRVRVLLDELVAGCDYIGYHAPPSVQPGSWLSIHVDKKLFLCARVILRPDRQCMPGIQVYDSSAVSYGTFKSDVISSVVNPGLDSEERERLRGIAPPLCEVRR